MNDFSEVEHGTGCINDVLNDKVVGTLFRRKLDAVQTGLADRAIDKYISQKEELYDSFMSCLSEHVGKEDQIGRLSMWRAYGCGSGVAIVFNPEPFYIDNDNSGIVTSPVLYAGSEGVAEQLKTICENITDAEINKLKQFCETGGEEILIESVKFMLQMAAISTKHEGFEEEREWRVITRPRAKTYGEKILMEVRGVPQPVLVVPLKDNGEIGIKGIEVKDFIERIIIGPAPFPEEICEAFVYLLAEAGVHDPRERVVISKIPLR